MSALRTSRNVTPAQPLLRRATAVHVLPLGQRCMRMIPQARVKQQEELGLVLSDLEREYFREVGDLISILPHTLHRSDLSASPGHDTAVLICRYHQGNQRPSMRLPHQTSFSC